MSFDIWGAIVLERRVLGFCYVVGFQKLKKLDRCLVNISL